MRGARLDFDVLRIPYALSILQLQSALARAKGKYPWSGKDGEDEYQAIGLQYHDPNNPYFDAVDRQATYIMGENRQVSLATEHAPFRFFDRRNLAGDEFEFVFRRIIPLRIYRSRLMCVSPGARPGNLHTDGARSIRLHIPIETNSDCWFEIDGRRHHLPADGSAYLINTSLMHRIGNEGISPRTHLVSVLFSRSDATLHPVALLAIRDFWEEHHGQDGAPAERLKKECEKRAGKRCELCKMQDRRLFHVPDQKMLRSVCAICIEDLARKNSLEAPGPSFRGLYLEHASREKKSVETLKSLLEYAVKS